MVIKKILSVGLMILCLLIFSSWSVPALADDDLKNPGYEYDVIGDPANVTTPTSPGLLLMGGSTDVDSALRWMISKSGGGDFVVIRATGTDAYNPYIYTELGGVNSAATIVLTKERAAFDPFVIEKIRGAEALFIAGGDQWDYVRGWKDTPVEDAIHYVVSKGAPVGGTSAGLAILGEFVFSAEHDTVTSTQALKNPYQPGVALASDFLKLPYLQGVITDSHFAARDRMGRLVTFLARLLQDGLTSQARGIGIDERTALVVEANGEAMLHGEGSVYFLQTTQAPEVCLKAKPLTFRNIRVYRISGAGATFDLANWVGENGTSYNLSAIDGALEFSLADGSIY